VKSHGQQLHIVSTGRQTDERLTEILKDIHPYMTALHVREKTKSAKELARLITQLVQAGVPLSKIIVNDRVDAAVCCQTKGVQLGFQSLDVSSVRSAFPDLMIGRSVHSIEEAKEAEHHGANFLLFGHIFKTGSKPGKEPKGLEQLKKVIDQTALPVIAIGGIHPWHVKEVRKTGAAGIAVMTGILEADSPLEAVIEYRSQLEVRNE
jgi:thiazole tautomerase (transcriptional regulator TenI)